MIFCNFRLCNLHALDLIVKSKLMIDLYFLRGVCENYTPHDCIKHYPPSLQGSFITIQLANCTPMVEALTNLLVLHSSILDCLIKKFSSLIPD